MIIDRLCAALPVWVDLVLYQVHVRGQGNPTVALHTARYSVTILPSDMKKERKSWGTGLPMAQRIKV